MPTTTNYGWTTADNDDPVDVVLDVSNLATQVDAELAGAAIDDTGWVTPAFTPAANYSTTTCKVRIRNGVLDIYWSGSPNAAGSVPANGDTPNTTVCTLPAPYRPTDHARPLSGGASGPLLGWVIATGGEIQMVSGPPNVAWGAGSSLSCGGSLVK